MTQIIAKDYHEDHKLKRAACQQKDAVLRYLNSFEQVAAAGGPFIDVVTGEYMWDVQYLAFEDNNWDWDSSDIYHFEKYDLELKPEFIEYALSKTTQGI